MPKAKAAHMPFSLRRNDARTDMARGRSRVRVDVRVRVRARVRKLCTRSSCTALAQTAAWCKGLCWKHAQQQGLSLPHKSLKKGLSRNRQARGKNPKGRRMSKAQAAKLKTSVAKEIVQAYRCKAKHPHALPEPRFQTLAEVPGILDGRKKEIPQWSSPCICLAV